MIAMVGLLFGAGVWLVIQSVAYPRRSRTVVSHSNIWPQFIDEIASGIQVGLSLQDSFFDARSVLPIEQRRVLDRSYFHLQHGSSFQDELQRLQKQLMSKDFTRLVTILSISTQQGVRQLASLLHDFSAALRRDNELMLEILAKYQTNKIAARVASVAPLFVLLFTASRAEVRSVYLTHEGLIVLFVITLVSIGGYLSMVKIASLPGIYR